MYIAGSSVSALDSLAYQNQLVNHEIQAVMVKDKIPGVAVLLYANNKMSAYYFGDANPKKHVKVSENTLFEIGSITKTFTGLLLSEDALENKMSLNEKVNKSVHFSNLPNITLQELATHTSSLPFGVDGLPYNASVTEKNIKKLNRFLDNWTPAFAPGTKMFYSNIGFSLLGMALAENAKTTLPAMMKNNILNPLGMYHSGLDITPADQNNLAIGFTEKGNPVSHLPSGLLAGSWAMKVSPKDMKIYLEAALGVTPIPEKIRKAIIISQTGYYIMPKQNSLLGFGWEITPLDNSSVIKKLTNNPAHYTFAAYEVKRVKVPVFNPHSLVAKSGATDGFRSYIAIIPDKKTGIVIMANRYFGSGDLPNLANKILFQMTK